MIGEFVTKDAVQREGLNVNVRSVGTVGWQADMVPQAIVQMLGGVERFRGSQVEKFLKSVALNDISILEAQGTYRSRIYSDRCGIGSGLSQF